MNAIHTAAALDEEGYLVDPEQWSEPLAEQLAEAEGLALGAEHWGVFRFMRDYYQEHGVIPDARHTIRYLAEEQGHGRKARNHLFALFPYGYVKQACKVAGMRRPRAWSTG